MKILRHHFALVDSTNNWVKLFPKTLPPETLLVVTADEQSNGRGRRGHSWYAPARGNLYVTFGLEIPSPFPLLPHVGQLAAIAAAETAIELCSVAVDIKWPNDLLFCNDKVGGILCEAVSRGECLRIAIGIGININIDKEALAIIGVPATSLKAARGNASEDISVEELLALLTDRFIELWQQLLLTGFSPLLPRYCSLLVHKAGDAITFHCAGEHRTGTFVEIDAAGAFTFINSQGELSRSFSGEIMI